MAIESYLECGRALTRERAVSNECIERYARAITLAAAGIEQVWEECSFRGVDKTHPLTSRNPLEARRQRGRLDL